MVRWGAAIAAVALSGAVVGVVTLAHEPTVEPPPAASEMTAAAQAFLELLDASAKEQATYSFTDDERYNWHFVPRARNGLPLKEMTAEQRGAAHTLLQTTLSAQGYLKTTAVMELERTLGVLENRPERRDPERYYLTIFGTPSMSQPWGWRFEGHHLSLNFTSATNELVATTPAFMGANPARVPSGPSTGWRVLGKEEDRARDLLRLLSPEQRAVAIIAEEAPRDIITGADREARLDRFEGLPASEMTDGQRTLLFRLMEEYTRNVERDLADRYMEGAHAMPLDQLYFAWAGSLEPGRPHYYRIHGPSVLIEYDNTQNDANHVHAVWRDLEDDFGEDLLRKHYEEAGHH